MKLPIIDGRECVPVRLLPFLTDWDPLTPDGVAQLFAGRHPWHKWSLPLFRFQRDGTYGAVSARSWEDVAIDLEELEASLTGQPHPIWRRRSVELLPTAEFVWKTDLEAEYARTYLNPVRFRAGPDATPRELDFARPLSPEEEELVFDGFGAPTDTTTAQASTSARPSHPRAETQSPGPAQLANALVSLGDAVSPQNDAFKLTGARAGDESLGSVGVHSSEIAAAFGGLYWESINWKRNLDDHRAQWIRDSGAKWSRGKKGNKPVQATWNPVKLAVALALNCRRWNLDFGVKLQMLDARFAGREELVEWRTRWAEERSRLTGED